MTDNFKIKDENKEEAMNKIYSKLSETYSESELLMLSAENRSRLEAIREHMRAVSDWNTINDESVLVNVSKNSFNYSLDDISDNKEYDLVKAHIAHNIERGNDLWLYKNVKGSKSIDRLIYDDDTSSSYSICSISSVFKANCGVCNCVRLTFDISSDFVLVNCKFEDFDDCSMCLLLKDTEITKDIYSFEDFKADNKLCALFGLCVENILKSINLSFDEVLGAFKKVFDYSLDFSISNTRLEYMEEERDEVYVCECIMSDELYRMLAESALSSLDIDSYGEFISKGYELKMEVHRFKDVDIINFHPYVIKGKEKIKIYDFLNVPLVESRSVRVKIN